MTRNTFNENKLKSNLNLKTIKNIYLTDSLDDTLNRQSQSYKISCKNVKLLKVEKIQYGKIEKRKGNLQIIFVRFIRKNVFKCYINEYQATYIC